jgi:hypothetical protein
MPGEHHLRSCLAGGEGKMEGKGRRLQLRDDI